MAFKSVINCSTYINKCSFCQKLLVSLSIGSLLLRLQVVVFLGLGAFIIFGIAPNFNAVGMTNLVEQGGFTKWFWRCSNGCRYSYFSFMGTEIVAIAAGESDEPLAAVTKLPILLLGVF